MSLDFATKSTRSRSKPTHGIVMAQRETQPQVDRRIPRWAAMLLARLAQDRPSVVTRDDIAGYLAETDSTREVEAAAWHLGYLDRRFTGPIAVWLPEGERPPFGLREIVSVIRLGWPEAMRSQIGPSRSLLRKHGLDLTRWADGLASFGPDALLVQLSSRPASFMPWADIAVHLSELADDCETGQLVRLLKGQSASAWQRAAYLLDLGSNADAADDVLHLRPKTRLSHVTTGDSRCATRILGPLT